MRGSLASVQPELMKSRAQDHQKSDDAVPGSRVDMPLDKDGGSSQAHGAHLDGVGFLLGVAHRARRRKWEMDLVDLGLTAPQAAILRVLAAQPGLGVRDLARRLGTDPMNAQRITETLISAGLCEAGRDPTDARRRPVYPTERGSQLARTVSDRARQSEGALADSLGKYTYEVLADALRLVISFDGVAE